MPFLIGLFGTAQKAPAVFSPPQPTDTSPRAWPLSHSCSPPKTIFSLRIGNPQLFHCLQIQKYWAFRLKNLRRGGRRFYGVAAAAARKGWAKTPKAQPQTTAPRRFRTKPFAQFLSTFFQGKPYFSSLPCNIIMQLRHIVVAALLLAAVGAVFGAFLERSNTPPGLISAFLCQQTMIKSPFHFIPSCPVGKY